MNWFKKLLLIAMASMGISNVESQSVKDINGNSYKTVVIGKQTWMAENLNVNKFKNGDVIAEAKTYVEWKTAGENKQPAWCYYNNDPINGRTYGKLYNWYAVNDSRGLAPLGWRVPSIEEWSDLTDFLGGDETAGEKMKSTSGWPLNGNGTNESGIAGIPAGQRDFDGMFSYINEYGIWWSSSSGAADDYATLLNIGSESNEVRKGDEDMSDGSSVRCLKD